MTANESMLLRQIPEIQYNMAVLNKNINALASNEWYLDFTPLTDKEGNQLYAVYTTGPAAVYRSQEINIQKLLKSVPVNGMVETVGVIPQIGSISVHSPIVSYVTGQCNFPVVSNETREVINVGITIGLENALNYAALGSVHAAAIANKTAGDSDVITYKYGNNTADITDDPNVVGNRMFYVVRYDTASRNILTIANGMADTIQSSSVISEVKIASFRIKMTPK